MKNSNLKEIDQVKKILTDKFSELTHLAIKYKHLIDGAKTDLKKTYFSTKLKKVNKQVYNVMAQLTMIDPSLLKSTEDEDEKI